MSRKRWVVAAALVCGTSVSAQQRPVRLSAVGPDGARAGTPVTVVVSAAIQPGWHLYSLTEPSGGPIPTRIVVGPRALVQSAGAIKSPLPETSRDPNFGLSTEFYSDSVSFRIPLLISATAHPGKQFVSVSVRYQACSARLCLRPRIDSLRVPLVVTGP